MSTQVPRILQKTMYEREAQIYLHSLPLEHFMESVGQATRRKITVSSLDLVAARRKDVHVFSELLVQYRVRGKEKTGKVVPDNMVVITTEPIEAVGSYNVELEPAEPFWVMEYVSAGNPRKDYEDSFSKYETKLKVPYYLIFHPEEEKLTLNKLNGRDYVAVRPNSRGRLPVPELEIEVALLDGWVRFWYQGKLLPLPAELQDQLDDEKRRSEELRQRLADEKHRSGELQQSLADQNRRSGELQQSLAEEKRQSEELQQKLAAAEKELAALRRRNGNGQK